MFLPELLLYADLFSGDNSTNDCVHKPACLRETSKYYIAIKARKKHHCYIHKHYHKRNRNLNRR